MAKLTRREFLKYSAALAYAGTTLMSPGQAWTVETTQIYAKGFFTIGRRNGRCRFITPEGEPFFSIGLNHIDSVTLRYAENIHIWRRKYDNSMERWLKESVRKDLLAWGFNTIGWVQEVVTRGVTNHRHSRNFTYEEYQWLNMPYCHMLPFADFHQWEVETRNPDLYSKDFENWCDYVARSHCARFADDPKFIGYFYIDCPTWVHARKGNEWKGPLFDPEKLKTEEGKKELFELASRYYKAAYEAIRRYDKHHLILGDRYEARAPLPEQVLLAAKPYVDVFSFQHFGKPEDVQSDLEHFARLTGKPVLLADHARSIKEEDGTLRNDPKAYQEMMRRLRRIPACVGFHLCGAYLRNRVRRRGLRDEQEWLDVELIKVITETNLQTKQWIKQITKE